MEVAATLLMVQKSCEHQLRLVVEIPLFTRFYTSRDFFHQQYVLHVEVEVLKIEVPALYG